MKKKAITILMAITMVLTLFAGCKGETNADKEAASNLGDASKESSNDVKEFTAFFAVEGAEINNDNEIQQKIADITGAKCKETWLTGQAADEAVGMLIASGEYPDFIDGSTGTPQLVDAGALVPIDEYLDDYPNIKNFWSEEEWNKLKNEDGHIYYIPQFGNVYMKSTDTIHGDEAFWIQTRVLKWAGYPKVESLDQLFELLESYYEANPTMKDGTSVIPYEILTDDWYYYCLENAPQFLGGYPNDGSVIVDPDTYQVIDYNTTDTAIKYFKKLNEEYNKGIVDPESFTASRDQYIEKISSGRVLCMVDQHWNFLTAEDSIKSQGLDDCTYVPLGITIEEGMAQQYHSAPAFNEGGGLGITTSCKDIEGALQFLNDLLSKEVTTLRSWGVEGEDYLVDDEGLFYRTQEMRDESVDSEYKASHLCTYSYFPNYVGMSLDGINAYMPTNQPTEFFDGLSADVKECFSAYGVQTYVEMLGSANVELKPWYPMWSYAGSLTTATPGGLAWTQMGEIKHEYLSKVVVSDDFDTAWEEYMKVYKACKPEDFLSEMQEEVYNRIEVATGEDVRPAK